MRHAVTGEGMVDIALASIAGGVPVTIPANIPPTTEQGGNLLNVAGATTSQTSAVVQTPRGVVGAVFRLTTTANPGGGQTLSLGLRTDFLGGVAAHFLVFFGVLITAANVDAIAVGAPGITVGDYNGTVVVATAVKQIRLPSRWVVQVTHSGAGAWTYRLDYLNIYG